MLEQIIGHTPLWVWALLLTLVWLGYAQVRERRVSRARLLFVPIVLIAWSLSAVVGSFGADWAAMSIWAACTAVAAWLSAVRPPPAGARFDPEARLIVIPGSWIPLVLILGIFVTHYAVNVALAMQHELIVDTGFRAGVSAAYGLLGGMILGRAGRFVGLRQGA